MKVSFVIPFHNEEKNCLLMVKRVLNYAKKIKLNFEIVPVDDRSSDKTKSILRSLAKKHPKYVKPHFRKKDKSEVGNTMGKALKEGTKKATGEIIVWTMGDLADDIKTYTQIIKKIEKGYDMVFGSRYMAGGSSGNLEALKAFLSSWGTRLARLLFNVPVHDITNAFRGFRKQVFNEIDLISSGFSISPEFAIKAHLKGFRLGEVPTVYSNRVEGISNFKLFKMTKSYLKMYINIYYNYKLPHLFQSSSKSNI